MNQYEIIEIHSITAYPDGLGMITKRVGGWFYTSILADGLVYFDGHAYPAARMAEGSIHDFFEVRNRL